MARCNCSSAATGATGTCSCAVQAGANVTVTGTGNTGDPYIISSSGGGPGGTPYVAGAGLTETPAATFNVGQGAGIVVSADTVSADTAFLDARYAVAPEVHVGLAAPTSTADLLWSNTAGSVGSASPGAASGLAPTFVRDGTTGLFHRATPAIVDDLRDVDTTTVPPVIGQTLQWNGVNWVPAAGGAGAPEVHVGGAAPTTGAADLLSSNTAGSVGSATPGPTSGLAPTFVRDATSGTYFRATPAIVDDLKDVDTTTVAPVIGQTLQWNGTNWVPGAGGGGAQYIDQLLDVDTSTVPPVDGHTLVWNTTQWVPAIRLREVVQATAPVGARQLRWVQPS